MMKSLNKFAKMFNSSSQIFNKTKNVKFTTNITAESFASGANAIYIEYLYSQWLANPSSVDLSWQNYFTNVERNLEPGSAFQSPPTIDPSKIYFNRLNHRLFIKYPL